ncbi:MAG: permease-like cell division protein FtsX [Oscillospiraceae bacterium]|nr:permease-like cell division protein FtsX [Oscillospiraceae bacterium]MBR5363483.1 permease-like cell division protein FtsX [Oscillospiraceae bacterium]
MKLSSFRYLVRQGFDNVWKNRVMAFASFCVLLVSLLLVGISVLFYVNINAIIGGIEDKNEVIVYLSETTSEERRTEIGDELAAMKNIASVQLYTKEEALEDLKVDMSDQAIVFESLGDDNPLLDAYRIRVADISKMDETISATKKMQDVDSVRSPDSFVELLTEMRRVVTIVAIAIIIALFIVSMVIISNTTRASVFSRRREISIMQSVGATKAFIRFPFFIEGMINGFMAGVFATLLTWFAYDSLVNLLGRFDVLSTIGLGNVIPLSRIYVIVMLSYIFAGSLIGAFGSVLSTRVHLRYRAANM